MDLDELERDPTSTRATSTHVPVRLLHPTKSTQWKCPRCMVWVYEEIGKVCKKCAGDDKVDPTSHVFWMVDNEGISRRVMWAEDFTHVVPVDEMAY